MKIRCFYGDTLVGQLVEAPQEGRIYFQYGEDFRRSGLELSPIHLPSTLSGPITFPDPALEGLPGLFYDSLPDTWGRRLMMQRFQEQGLLPEQVGPLLMLSYVGNRGIGALRYEPDLDAPQEALEALDLIALNRAAGALEGEPEAVLRRLRAAGGTAGGMRPKAFVVISEEGKFYSSPFLKTPPSSSHWLVKFDTLPSRQYGRIEYAYSLMARDAGIEVPETRLLEMNDEEGNPLAIYAIRRFDRENGARLHFHSLAGILHHDFSSPTLAYERIAALLTRIPVEKRTSDAEELCRRMIFNVLASNRDDHAKNFGFIMDGEGRWRLSPAYDLTFAVGKSTERRQTGINGRWENISRDDLLFAAKQMRIGEKRFSAIFDQVSTAVRDWPKYAVAAGISENRAAEVSRFLKS